MSAHSPAAADLDASPLDLPLERSWWPWLSFALIMGTVPIGLGLVLVLGIGWLFTLPIGGLVVTLPAFLLMKALYHGRVLWPNAGWRLTKAVVLLTGAAAGLGGGAWWAWSGDPVATHLAPLLFGLGWMSAVLAVAVMGAHPNPAVRSPRWRRWSEQELEQALPWKKAAS